MARTLLKSLFAIASPLILVLVANEARADVRCDFDLAAPEIVGEIVPGDFDRLLRCLGPFVKVEGQAMKPDRHGFIPLSWVTFDSEGGDVVEAIKIGTFLREALAEVYVREKCFSACFLAVVGAVEIRNVGPTKGGKIGIHRVFHSADTLKRTEIKQYETNYNHIRQGARK